MTDELVVLLRGSGTSDDLRRTTEALKKHTRGLDLRSIDREDIRPRDFPRNDDAHGGLVRVISAKDGGDALCGEAVWDVVRSSPVDLVLLRVGCVVRPGWRETLHAAAYADAIIATASAIPADVLAVADASNQVSRTPNEGSSYGTALGEPMWGCVYVRRDALRVALAARSSLSEVGPATPEGLEEALLVPGLVHVLAKTVVSFGDRDAADGVATVTPAVQRALDTVERASEHTRVTVDLRCCSHPLSGTQVHAINLVQALARTQDIDLSVLLPPQLHQSVRSHVDALPPSVRRLSLDQPSVIRPHVFHRPYQLQTETEITDVLRRGDRLVVTHQDMILDRTPAYFPSKTHWRAYSAATAVSFVAADEVAFYSEHAREEAIRDGLIDPAKTCVVPPGTNHLDDAGAESRPADLQDTPASESLILVLCNSYFHKNRVFALRVAEELRAEHGWTGVLLFAGGSPTDGSSIADEAAFLARHPQLQGHFVDLGRVSDEEQRWLYRHTALVVYSTLYEGFGLIPFEAAAAGTPCVYSSRSSVAEYLPAEGALLDLADVEVTAARLAPLLERAEVGEPIVGAIRRAARELTWDRNAEAYADIYNRVLERPVGLALASAGDVVVGARSQLAVDTAELGLLFAWRRFPRLRIAARALVSLVFKVRATASRRR